MVAALLWNLKDAEVTVTACREDWTIEAHAEVQGGVCRLSVSVDSCCASPGPFERSQVAIPAGAPRGYSSSSDSSVDVTGAIAHMLSTRPLLQNSPERNFQQRADSIEHTMCADQPSSLSGIQELGAPDCMVKYIHHDQCVRMVAASYVTSLSST
jgi:hypothetical protein